MPSSLTRLICRFFTYHCNWWHDCCHAS